MPLDPLAPLTVDSPCPECGEKLLDSLDDDGREREYVEEWSCGGCDAQFNVVYTFSRTERVTACP